jgi:hypothetical protein
VNIQQPEEQQFRPINLSWSVFPLDLPPGESMFSDLARAPVDLFDAPILIIPNGPADHSDRKYGRWCFRATDF